MDTATFRVVLADDAVSRAASVSDRVGRIREEIALVVGAKAAQQPAGGGGDGKNPEVLVPFVVDVQAVSACDLSRTGTGGKTVKVIDLRK
jgi:hypothetical protein